MNYVYAVGGQPQSEIEYLTKLYEEIQKDADSSRKLKLIFMQNPPANDEEAAQKYATSDHKKVAKPKKGALIDIEARELGLHPPVEALRKAIITDPEINIFFHQMFWQQFQLPDISGSKKIWCWQVLIVHVDYIMTRAPEYNQTPMVASPISAFLKWPMNTAAGFTAFLNEKVNKLFKNILNYWGVFLKSPKSAYVLSKDPRKGWLGEDAMKAMPDFEKNFICDPKAPHYGFTSWDDFFIREFRPGCRPVASPDDDLVIANACESAPYRLARNVQNRNYFWIKSQQYSLDFILNNDKIAEKFYGGTVYQAYLSPTSYHRFHSPVSGYIMKTEVVDGSYFSQTYNSQTDPANILSQGYLCQVASRGIIHILADNREIGLVCFVSIGMVEVSTNDITVKAGDYVKKGDQLGMFHFGGSSHCLIFQPGVKIQFDLHGETPGLNAKNIPVRSKIAIITPKNSSK